jgi:hypothetical protein
MAALLLVTDPKQRVRGFATFLNALNLASQDSELASSGRGTKCEATIAGFWKENGNFRLIQ